MLKIFPIKRRLSEFAVYFPNVFFPLLAATEAASVAQYRRKFVGFLAKRHFLSRRLCNAKIFSHKTSTQWVRCVFS